MQSDLFHYMSLKCGGSGEAYSYFNYFKSPVKTHQSQVSVVSLLENHVFKELGERALAIKCLASSLLERDSFRFYLDSESPTELKARDLKDFLDELMIIDLKSISFHLRRSDFSNWILN